MKTVSKAKSNNQQGANIMGRIRLLAEADTLAKAHIRPLVACPHCNVEMGLLGVESDTETRDLYTFECHACGGLEVRGVRVR
jgi:hypothetical protein